MNDRDLLQAGYRYALSLRALPQDAEDLVQEAWLRLYRSDSAAPDKALLFTAVRNLYIDQYRRNKLIVLENLDEAADTADSAAALDSSMQAQALAEPLARLRPEEREALFLNVVEGYSAEEIATFTQRPRGTILSLVHRAKRKLQRFLGEPAQGLAGGQRS